MRQRSPAYLLEFEQGYERIGMPALVIQVLTGLALAYRLLPDLSQWLSLDHAISQMIASKLLLLTLTLLLALDARFRVIPKLNQANLWDMAWHIIGVTFLAVGFVLTGLSLRLGWGLFAL